MAQQLAFPEVASEEPLDYPAFVRSEAVKFGLDPELVHRLVTQESAYKPDAVSKKGAIGLMQLMPDTAAAMGVDPHDPYANVRGGLAYLRSLVDLFDGDTTKAVAAYNAGPDAVQKAGGVPNIKETQDYVSAIVKAPAVSVASEEPIPGARHPVMQAVGFTDPNSVKVTEPAPHVVHDVDPKTGLPITHIPLGQIPVLDAPAVGIPRMVRGAADLIRAGAAQLATPEVLPPEAHVVRGKPAGESSMHAANELLEGAMQAAQPLVAAAAITNPVPVGLGIVRAYIASKFGEAVAEQVSASPEATRLAGNIMAVASGTETVTDVTRRSAAKVIEKAQETGRNLSVTATLSGSGYGTGDVPGFRGTPYADTQEGRVTERPPTQSQLDLEQQIRDEDLARRQASAERAAHPPPAAAEQPPPSPSTPPSSTTASVPFMIPRAMRTDLKELGWTDKDIDGMKPADAHAILNAGTRKPVEVAAEEPLPPEFGAGATAGPVIPGGQGTRTPDQEGLFNRGVGGAPGENVQAKINTTEARPREGETPEDAAVRELTERLRQPKPVGPPPPKIVDINTGREFTPEVAHEEPIPASASSTAAPAPTEPIYFRSGASRPADFEGFAKAKVPVGVTVTELSVPMADRVVQHVAEGGQVFVDSGAFTGNVDFKDVMGRYEQLANAIEDRGGTLENLHVVAPDVVGDARATEQLQAEHAPGINALLQRGVKVIVPVQKDADTPLDQQLQTVELTFPGATVGIPFNKAAFTKDELLEGLQTYTPKAIHLLGLGEKNRAYKDVLGAIQAEFPQLQVSSDSNRLAAMFGKGRPGTAAVESRVKETAPEQVDNAPASDTTELTDAFFNRNGAGFSAKERKYIAESLNTEPKTLNAALAKGGEGVQALVDRGGGDQLLDMVLNNVALQRAGKAMRPLARTETIAASESWPYERKANLFPAPAETVRAKKVAGDELLTEAQADKRLAEWKAEVQRVAQEEDHSNEVVFSLFDHSGVWSKPYEDAGYQVVRLDIKDGDDLTEFFPLHTIQQVLEAGFKVVGVLAAPPCTSFAVSGARWWESQHDKADEEMVEKKYGFKASKYFDTPLDYANTLVRAVELFLELANPSDFYAMENPVGRIAEQNQLPKPTLTFDPSNYGNPYTKKTLLWGEFNPDLPTANVDPKLGSYISVLSGDSPEDKEERSITPEGFAYAFFMANHQAAHEVTAEQNAKGAAFYEQQQREAAENPPPPPAENEVPAPLLAALRKAFPNMDEDRWERDGTHLVNTADENLGEHAVGFRIDLGAKPPTVESIGPKKDKQIGNHMKAVLAKMVAKNPTLATILAEAPAPEVAKTEPVPTTEAPAPATEAAAPAAAEAPAGKNDKDRLIEQILAAARDPVPDYVEKFETKGDDGKWYSAFGVPQGVTLTDETKSVGWVQRTREGTTVGNRYPSKQAAIDAWNAAQDRKLAEFRTTLEDLGLEAVKAKADFWLGERHAQSLKAHDDYVARLREGDTTPEELQAAFKATLKNGKALRDTLETFTKDELLKRLGPMGSARYKGEKKNAVVQAAWRDLLMEFHLEPSLSYGMGEHSFETALQRDIDKATPESIKAYAERVAKAREEYRARIAGYKKALENPETLEEFDNFVKMKGEKALTPEQLTKYDELRAKAGREKRAAEGERKATITGGTTVNAEIIETTHTKKGHKLFVVQLAERVERDAYNALNLAAKKLGGYYSSFRGQGAVPGFQFKDRETAEAFQKLAQEGEGGAATEIAQERREGRQEQKKNAAAERLAEMADRLEDAAQQQLNADRLVNTSRRAAQAASAEASARADLELARTLRNLSTAIENGDATHLDGIRTKTQVQLLESIATQAKYEHIRTTKPEYRDFEKEKDRALHESDAHFVKYPNLSANRSSLMSAAREMRQIGAKGIANRLESAGEKAPTDDRYIDVDRELVEKAVQRDEQQGRKMLPWGWKATLTNLGRLEAAGIPDLPTLRAAIREYIKYRGEQVEENRVKKLERDLAHKGEIGKDFFPTPEALADRMAEALDVQPGMTVLEPSAGNGNLVDAVRRQQPDAVISTIELSSTLREILEAKGYDVVAHDFDSYEPEGVLFDRIIMNPPFSESIDATHVQKAYEMLKPGGRMVAITGEGIFFRDDKRAQAFRKWFDSVEGRSEPLKGAFTDRRQVHTTSVGSRMLVIDKPAEAPAAEVADELGQPPKFWTGGHGPGTPEFQQTLGEAQRTVKRWQNKSEDASNTKNQIARHKYGTKARGDAERKLQAIEEDLRDLNAKAREAEKLVRMMKLRQLAEDESAPLERRWAAVLKAAEQQGEAGDAPYNTIAEKLTNEVKRQLKAAGLTDDDATARAGGLVADMTSMPLVTGYGFAETVARTVKFVERDKARTAALAKLAELETEYGIQSSQHQRAIGRSETPEDIEAALQAAEDDFKKTKEQQEKREAAEAADREEKAAEDKSTAQLLALKGRLGWAWTQAGNKTGQWKPTEAYAVEIPGAPKGFTFFVGKNVTGSGWNVTEESTGLSVGSGGNRNEAIEHATEQLKLHGDKLAAKVEAVLKEPRPERPIPNTIAAAKGKKTTATDTPAEAAAHVEMGVAHTLDLKGAKSAKEVLEKMLAALRQAKIEAESLEEQHGAKNAELREAHTKALKEWQDERNRVYAAVSDELRPELKKQPGQSLNQIEAAINAEVEKRFPLKGKPKEPAYKLAGKLRIDVPGDGDFTIERDARTIEAVIDRIRRGGPTPWKGLIAEEKIKAKQRGPTVDELTKTKAQRDAEAKQRASRGGKTDKATAFESEDESKFDNMRPAEALQASIRPLRQAGAEIRATMTAPDVSKSARLSSRYLRLRLAQMIHTITVAQKRLMPYRNAIERLTIDHDVILALADMVEHPQPGDVLPTVKNWRGKALPLAPWLEIRDEIYTFLKKQIKDLGIERQWKEYYLGHIWEKQFKDNEGKQSTVDQIKAKLNIGRRPLQGPKSFLKRRTVPDMRTGVDRGLEPVTWNLVDIDLFKIREMSQFILGQQALQDNRSLGTWTFRTALKPAPDPSKLLPIPDPIGQVWAPPEITLAEAYDVLLTEGLENFVRGLGVKYGRKPMQGATWGYTERKTGDITMRRGAPEATLMHEIGHTLDTLFGLGDRIREKLMTPEFPGDKSNLKELAALAKLRYEGRKPTEKFSHYVQERREQIANLVHAYLYAPDRAKKVAPNAYDALDELVLSEPALEPLQDLQNMRSLVLGQREYTQKLPGPMLLGRYYAPPEVVRIFRNHLTPGLGANKLWQLVRVPANALTQAKLSFSAFHAFTITQESAAMEAARGITDVLRGRPGGVARFGKALGEPIAVLVRGHRVRQQYLGTLDPMMLAVDSATNLLLFGGGRIEQSHEYTNRSLKKWTDNLRRANASFIAGQHGKAGAELLAAGMRTLPALIEAAAWPILQWLVPTAKAGATVTQIASELEHLPGRPTEQTLLAVASKAVNFSDAILGEVIWDNYFLNRALMAAVHMAVQAPGWRGGSAITLVRGLTDPVRRLFPSQREDLTVVVPIGAGGGPGGAEPPEVMSRGPKKVGEEQTKVITVKERYWSPYTSFVIAAFFVQALISEIYQQAHGAGHVQSMLDVSFPKTGSKEPDGKPSRVRLPGLVGIFYDMLRDVPKSLFEYALGGTAPLPTVVGQLYNNETYFGDEIVNAGDPWRQQAADYAKFLAEQAEPISVSSYGRRTGSTVEKAESVLGISPAPVRVTRSDLETYLHSIQAPTHRTKDQAERAQARRDLSAALRNPAAPGSRQQMADAIARGLSPRSVEATIRSERMNYTQREYARTTLPQAVIGYELATPQERYLIKPYLQRKAATLIQDVPVSERIDTLARVRAALQLPVSPPSAQSATAR